MSGRVLLLFLLACGLRAAELPDLVPGREISVPWEGCKNDLVVRLPDDWTADRTWPVVFHFHGTGGNPTIDIPLRYTAGKSFVLVGMEYVTRDLPSATPDYLEREWTHLVAVRDALVRRAKVNAQRVYVGGFSQGGWFASEFMEVHGRELAGAYILGAGKRPRNKRDPKPLALKQAVYLGIGQFDPNYIYSVQGIKHFGSLGGAVTFDEFFGLDHHMPMGGGSAPLAQSLLQWFHVEDFRGREAGLLSEATGWAATQKESISADKEPLRQWLRLTRTKRAPFFALLPGSQKQAFDAALAELERLPALKQELAVRTQYLSLLDRELRGPSDVNLWPFTIEQAKKYHALWLSAPDSHHGRRALVEFARLRDQLNHPEMWRFPNDEQKAKMLALLQKDPLPDVPKADLAKDFRELRNALEPQ